MPKLIFTLSICLLSIQLTAQEKPITKYYDSLWSPTEKESAFYFAEFSKQGYLYKCTAYWVNPKILNGVGFFADTNFAYPQKLLLNYYQNGRLQDSSSYNKYSEAIYNYHFYKSGKLLASRIYDTKTGQYIIEGFDEDGKLNKDFIYAREAAYPEGDNAWLNFVSKNLNSKIPIKNKAPIGTYQVIILFMIDKKGQIAYMKPETNYGYGMEEEAMRVIRNSPRWLPLISLGEAGNAWRRQPVTFIVSEK